MRGPGGQSPDEVIAAMRKSLFLTLKGAPAFNQDTLLENARRIKGVD